jgi:hypothetical protein
MRAAYILMSATLGALAGCFGQPYIHENTDAVTLLVTVFTVFAGFSVAILTILGNPESLPPGSWRAAEQVRAAIDAKLIRHGYLFGVYLVTLVAIFISLILKKASDETVPVTAKVMAEKIFLGLSVTALLLSLALPKMLMDVQRARADAEIGRRRKEEGIGD